MFCLCLCACLARICLGLAARSLSAILPSGQPIGWVNRWLVHLLVSHLSTSLYLSTSPPFRLVHLSTIVYLPAGPLAGWFTSRLVHLTTSPPHGKFTNLAPTSRLVHLTAISPLVRTSSRFVTINITDRCYHHALLKITGETGVNPHEPAETTATVNWD